MFEILIKFYIISEACLKIHPRAKVTEIEEAVAETPKHAPSHKDGPKYKKVGINLVLWWDYIHRYLLNFYQTCQNKDFFSY